MCGLAHPEKEKDPQFERPPCCWSHPSTCKNGNCTVLLDHQNSEHVASGRFDPRCCLHDDTMQCITTDNIFCRTSRVSRQPPTSNESLGKCSDNTRCYNIRTMNRRDTCEHKHHDSRTLLYLILHPPKASNKRRW